MRRLLSGFVLSTLLVAAVFAAAPPALTSDAHDLILLHPKRPYRIRLHLLLRGQSYQKEWNHNVSRLFRHLDRNKDGILSKEELRQAPSQEQWRQLTSAAAIIDPDPAPPFDELAKGTKGITLAMLQEFYSRSTAGPLQLLYRESGPGDSLLSQRLFQVLDRNRDGKLTKNELEVVASSLAKLDFDDDDIINSRELFDGQFVYLQPGAVTTGVIHGPAPAKLPVFSFKPDRSVTTLIDTLIAHYDRDGSKTLSQNEIGFLLSTFARLDRNKNKTLDRVELGQWIHEPVDLELRVPIDAIDQPITRIGKGSAEIKVSKVGGDVLLRVGSLLMQIQRRNPLPRGGGKARDTVLARFRSLDRDSNGYIDRKDVFVPPFEQVALLRLADRDGDEKVTQDEFFSFSDLQNALYGQVTHCRLAAEGKSLFHLLDSDGDGQLGPREVRSAWKRVSPVLNGKDALTEKTIPQQFRLTIGFGPLPANPGEEILPMSNRPRTTMRGPLWFRKMDRNLDGDVSMKEWLGSEKQFRLIDRDGDGLISAEEAEWFDRMNRKGK